LNYIITRFAKEKRKGNTRHERKEIITNYAKTIYPKLYNIMLDHDLTGL